MGLTDLFNPVKTWGGLNAGVGNSDFNNSIGSPLASAAGKVGNFFGIGNSPDTSGFENNGDPNNLLGQFGNDPASSQLSAMISGIPKFQDINAQTVNAPQTQPYQMDAYKAKDMSNAVLPQYEAMRNRLNNQYNSQQQQSQEALDRQFAAAGGGPGNGAQAKQTENLSAGIAAQKGNDLLGINSQEAQARQDLQNLENQKEFQSGETQKGYGFQAGQADLGRQFQAAEENAQLGQGAQEFNKQMEQAQNQFGVQAQMGLANLNTSWKQAQAEAQNNEYNKRLADYQARHSGGLLGGGGFLGLGFGA